MYFFFFSYLLCQCFISLEHHTMWTRDILLIKAIEISHFLWYFECTKKKQFVTTRLLACHPSCFHTRKNKLSGVGGLTIISLQMEVVEETYYWPSRCKQLHGSLQEEASHFLKQLHGCRKRPAFAEATSYESKRSRHFPLSNFLWV